MADYGVNIAVAVKNSQAVTQLSNKLKDTAAKIEFVNKHFNTFANMTGKVLPGSIANFNKALADAAKNLSDVALNTEDAVTAAREFVQAQNAANAALRERDRLVKQIRREGETVREQPFGTAGFAGGPQLPPGFDPVVGRKRALAQMVMLETKADAKIADAKRKYILDIGQIKLDLDRKIRNAEIDNIIEEYRIQNQFEDAKFQKLMKNTELFEAKFFEQLGIRKNEEKKAIKEVEQERRRALRESIMLTGQTSPIGGAENIPGSPAAKAKVEREQRFLRDKFNRDQRLRSATSSALIGGAFPLLFGQGLGAAGGGLVGGFGGGMIGGEFGFGLSLVGTQLGSLLDQFATKASELGAALNPLTADIEAVAAAAGESNTEFGQLLSAYEEELGAKEALEFATNRLATVVGIDGVNALSTFNSDMVEAGNEFSKFTSIVLAAIADLINQSGFLRGAANLAERSRLLISARRSGDPEVQKLMRERQKAQNNVQSFLGEVAPDKVAGQIATVMSIEDQIILLQRANEAKELGLQQDELSAKLSEKQLQGLRGTRSELEARNVILRNNGDLLNDEVFNAERTLLIEKMRAKVAKITKTQREAEVKLSDEAFDEQIDQAVLDYNNNLLALTNRRADAQQAADDKAARAAEAAEKAANRATKKAEREDRRKQRAIEKRIKATDTEIERATKAFERVDSQLDDIINKNKDKVAFEREYAELIRGGSTPAAAQQAIELKKQLLELDRRYEKEMKALDAQLAKTELVILEQIAVDGVTDAIKRQIEEYNRLKDVRDGLAEKKEGAEGAINEALAPKSDRERLQEYLDKLQEQLNDLNDPVRQITALAETLGSAFSESFKGIVDGSMSAQQALANLFQRTADHFLDMAAQMIAAQVQMKILGIGMQFFGGGGHTPLPGSAPQMTKEAIVTPTGFTGQFGGMAALGGSVTRGNSYIVGERGPELFVPGAQGNIVPNNAMGGANVTVNVDASGSSVEGNSDQAAQLGRMLGAAVQAELVKQKRPGGLLAS